MGEFGAMRTPGEQAENVGLESLGEHVLGRRSLVMHRDAAGERANLGGQLPLRCAHGVGGDLREPGQIHGKSSKVEMRRVVWRTGAALAAPYERSSVETSSRSNRSPSHHTPH